ncbi:MAG: histidine kinase [Melioribacteraceae bacterium]
MNRKIFLDTDAALILPMLLVLTLAAFVNSSQYFFFLFQGDKNYVTYILIVFSKLVYFYYFLLLAVLLYLINLRIRLKVKKILLGISIHIILLIASFFVHQSLTHIVDKVILGEQYTLTLRNALFNNPLAWIDIVAYILLLAGILLLDSKRLSRENEIKCAQLEVLLVKSKLQELRTKIHPRFLFKTLTSIKALISKNQNRKANNILTMLSEFLRTTVYSNEKEKVELEQELHFLRLYLDIEKEAFGEAITFNENVSEESLTKLVPSFYLQPIVEALLYEIIGEPNFSFALTIESDILNYDLRLSLSLKHESETRLDEKIISELAPIKVARERLSQLYDTNYGFEIAENGGELKLIIVFPTMEEYNESVSDSLMEN